MLSDVWKRPKELEAVPQPRHYAVRRSSDGCTPQMLDAGASPAVGHTAWSPSSVDCHRSPSSSGCAPCTGSLGAANPPATGKRGAAASDRSLRACLRVGSGRSHEAPGWSGKIRDHHAGAPDLPSPGIAPRTPTLL